MHGPSLRGRRRLADDQLWPEQQRLTLHRAAEIEVFTYNGHEGGAEYDLPRKLSALASAFGRDV